LLEAIRNGMTKVNIGTEIRQAYEEKLRHSGDTAQAQQACYQRTRWLLSDYFGLSGTRQQVFG
jgi:fructose/tagatose bisphosphate aldolase